ncbi:unnamed protein product, partial [Urochloa humidicola]
LFYCSSSFVPNAEHKKLFRGIDSSEIPLIQTRPTVIYHLSAAVLATNTEYGPTASSRHGCLSEYCERGKAGRWLGVGLRQCFPPKRRRPRPSADRQGVESKVQPKPGLYL